MFNKQGQQKNAPTLSEQINKTLDEYKNKLVLQYSKPEEVIKQPTPEEVRKTRIENFKDKQNIIKEYVKNKPLGNIQEQQPIQNEPILVKAEPETIQSIYNKSEPEQPQEKLYNIDKLVPHF